VDLTVVAVPFYFGSMGAEHWWLKRRAAERGPSPVDYEKQDTIASLTMGTVSLVLPLATRYVAHRIAPQRSPIGRTLVGVAGVAAGVTAVADQVRRRARSGRVRAKAERVARVAGPAAIVAGGVAVTSAWGYAVRIKRMWERRVVPDRGSGLLATAAAIAGWDFIYYWNHRFMHESRYMWAHHVVHHSSERYNLSTALRQPVTDSVATFAPYGLLCLAGIRPTTIETARGVNLLYQFWIHTDAVRKMGPLEEMLNTPSHHRVHHGSNQQYIDRNHGSILIAWDRLFGTFEREAEPVVYGLTKNIETFDPVRIITHEYADILRDVAGSENWADRLSYVVRGPGWAYRRHAEQAALAAG
jgi:sterol desaturase/sphingolipid hydroxylase (fatty acid hydroxylase superfamily)